MFQTFISRSEERFSMNAETDVVCRLLLEKKNLKAKGRPGPLSASDLAVEAGRELLARQPFAPSDLGEVILGCVMPSPDEANIGRLVALRLGCGKAMPACFF